MKTQEVLVKKEKGITLIALIVTIIVLLILAGITIGNLTTNSGVLNQSQNAKKETTESSEAEKLELAVMDALSVVAATPTGKLTTESVKNGIKGQFGEGEKEKVTGAGPWIYIGPETRKKYRILKDGTIQERTTLVPTSIYAKLYEDGALILSSTDYTDTSRILTEDFGFVENKDSSNYWSESDYCYEVKTIIFHDKIVPTSLVYYFSELPNLNSFENMENLETGLIEDMNHMFYDCYSLETIDLSNFDTSNVKDMSNMIYNCPRLRELDLSSFDTSNVTNMSYMIACSDDYGTDIKSLDLSSFNTSKVTTMNGMFSGLMGLERLNLESFDTQNVTDMSQMFGSCNALKTIYASNTFITNNVTDSWGMFNYCGVLEGGNGTTYNSSYTDKTYARIDTPSTPGYFTAK